MLLWDIPHQILETAPPRLFLSPALLARVLANARILLDEPSPFRSIGKTIRFKLGLLRRVYVLSCLEHIAPRLVITFIDNDYLFQWASRRLRHIPFFAVQNGTRLPYDVSTWLPTPPHPAHHISMPHFFCFGEHERDLYSRFGHKIDHYHPVGSVRASYYRSRIAKMTAMRNYDLCLISQWSRAIAGADTKLPEIALSLSILDEFLVRYASEHDVRLCVALRSSDTYEAEHFRHLFGDRAILIKNDRERMSTYAAIDASEVALAMDSTAGWEAFGWGHKILFCNFSGHDNYDFPCPGSWAINEPSYELFKSRLQALCAMEYAAFRDLSRKAAYYVMNHDDIKPAFETIRSEIRKSVARTSNA